MRYNEKLQLQAQAPIHSGADSNIHRLCFILSGGINYNTGGKMKPENVISINKALCYAEAQAEILVLSGDHEAAREIVLYLVEARAALIEESRK